MSMILFPPDPYARHERDRSLRAAEQWELQQAIRDADERARAERKAARKSSHRRHLRLLPHRTSHSLP